MAGFRYWSAIFWTTSSTPPRAATTATPFSLRRAATALAGSEHFVREPHSSRTKIARSSRAAYREAAVPGPARAHTSFTAFPFAIRRLPPSSFTAVPLRHSPAPTGGSPAPRFRIHLTIKQFQLCFGEISPKQNKETLTINKLQKRGAARRGMVGVLRNWLVVRAKGRPTGPIFGRLIRL